MLEDHDCPRCFQPKAEFVRSGKPYYVCLPCASMMQQRWRVDRAAPLPKPCVHCGLEKTQAQHKTRVSWICRPCASRKTREWNAAHPDASGDRYRRDPLEKAAYRRAYRAANRLHVLFRTRQYEAGRAGLPFTITMEDLGDPTTCACCSTALVWSGGHNSPSIDRVVPARGYVPGNVAWLCHRCNRRKSDSTADELEQLLWYTRRRWPGDGAAAPPNGF